MAAAACVAGDGLAAIQRLPEATAGRERRIVVQAGQMAALGGLPLRQLLRLAGAVPVEAGAGAACAADELGALLAEGAAAALCRWDGQGGHGLVDLAGFAWACRQAGVPALVVCEDAGRPLPALDAGATLVLLDPATLFGGPSAGLILGEAAAVGRCRLQERGLGALFACPPATLAAVLAAVGHGAGDLAAGLALPDHWPQGGAT